MLSFIFRIIYTAITFVETLIIFRIILKVINADVGNQIVSWIYNLSDYFVSPFKGVVAERMLIDRFELELTPLVALVFYIILAFVFSELTRVSKHTD